MIIIVIKIIIISSRNSIREKNLNKWCILHLLITHWPVPDSPGSVQLSPLLKLLPPVYILGTLYGVEYLFGQFGTPVLAVLPLSFLLIPSSPADLTRPGKSSLMENKQDLVKSKTSVYYQHCSHSESKILHCNSYWEKMQLYSSWNQENILIRSGEFEWMM